MSYHEIILIAATVNVILFITHFQLYKKKRKTRIAWAAFTIGFGLGGIIFYSPELIYGIPVGFDEVWPRFFICGTGVIMFAIGRIRRKKKKR